MDTLGDFNHAVIICGVWILDFFDEKPLFLEIELLNIICASSDDDVMHSEFEKFNHTVRCVNLKSKKILSNVWIDEIYMCFWLYHIETVR